MTFRLNPRLWYAVPAGAWLIAEVVNRIVLKQHMIVVFWAFQFLDPGALRDDFFRSMLLLHSQPPAFNFTLGLMLKLAAVLGCTLEAIANVLFGLLGLAAGLLLFHLTWRWTGSRILACAAPALYFANPSYYGGSSAGTGRNDFFYEFALQGVLLLVIASASLWLERSNYRSGMVFVLAVAIVVNTRTLFHPVLWGLVTVGAVLTPYVRKYPQKTAILAGGALLLVSAWAIKNYSLFGILTPSSLDGYNLDKGFVNLPEPLGHADLNSKLPDATDLLNRFPRIAGWPTKSLEVVTSGTKAGGGPNWNNLFFVTTRHEALARGLEARRNLGAVWDHAVFMYKFTTRQMYLHPYSGTAFGAYPDQFTGYLWLYDRLFYFPLSGGTPPRNALYWNAFAGLWLPVLLCGALIHLVLSKGDRILLGVLLYTAIFPIVIACLSDGYEGNRMRHSTYPLMILLSLILISTASRAVSFILARGKASGSDSEPVREST